MRKRYANDTRFSGDPLLRDVPTIRIDQDDDGDQDECDRPRRRRPMRSVQVLRVVRVVEHCIRIVHLLLPLLRRL